MRDQIQKLLDSDLSSLHIAKQTNVEQSTIYRLRKGERSLDNLGLSKAEKLYEFATALFNSEDDEKQNLLVKRASIMGMLQNLEMNHEESQKLEEELHDIEGKLRDVKKREIINNYMIDDIFCLVAAYKIGEEVMFHHEELKEKMKSKEIYFDLILEEVETNFQYKEIALEWLKDKDAKTIILYLDAFSNKY